MGGEKDHRPCHPVGVLGSPPRGRGKAAGGQHRAPKRGITPAWAGKSARCLPVSRFHEDHPRVGGEKLLWNAFCPPCQGSPPRGRGKDAMEIQRKQKKGITPAWAGKRGQRRKRQQQTEDHPRVGGEKAANIIVVLIEPGSPPRGRGKGSSGPLVSGVQGITPAWAGKRLKRSHRSGIFISGPIPFHSVLHRPAGSGGSRAGRDGSLAGQPQNAGPA